jgi:phosphoribosylaminoimidazole (AIR) synthetase
LIAQRVEEKELRRTFNAGVGYVVVAPRDEVSRAMDVLRGVGDAPFELGPVVRVSDGTAFEERVVWP